MAPFLQWLGPIVVAAHFQLIRATLQPHFNYLPLAQHKLEVFGALGVISVLSRVLLSRVSVKPSTLLWVAAYAAAVPALGRSGRWVGEFAGTLGPEWGAVVAQVVLAAPVVAILFPFCTPPVTRAGPWRPLVSICATAIPITLLAWASDLIEGNAMLSSSLADAPELGMLGMCMIFNALSMVYLFVPDVPAADATPAVAPPPPHPTSAVEEEKKSAKQIKKMSTKEREADKAEKEALLQKQKEDAVMARARAANVIPRPKPTPVALGLRALPLITAFAGFAAYPFPPFSGEDVTIHTSQASVSGRVIVGDNHLQGYRYLRADRALVGGVWIKNDSGVVELGDSVFATMPLQETALLARVPTKGDRLLAIGLGAGIGPSYYTQRGLDVDVVEYDLAVYEAARDYFGLAAHPPKAIHVRDGGRFVNELAQSEEGKEAYAYIVHDVFSAGGMPAHMFTKEFWQEAKAVLKPDGLVVMNIAGRVHSTMTRRIVATLISEFPHCRAFTDAFMPSARANIVKNLVFICSPISPVTFGKPALADTLGSALRERVYGSFGENEVKIADLLAKSEAEKAEAKEGEERDKADDLIRRGATSDTQAWDLELAKDVWASVGGLMPHDLWVTY